MRNPYRSSTWMVALLALATVLFAVSTAPSLAAEPVAVFHVGNSLTDQAYGMHDIAKARGHETKFGRHMIPGAPLDWLWNHRSEGFRAPEPKKPADEILKEAKWDALILQPPCSRMIRTTASRPACGSGEDPTVSTRSSRKWCGTSSGKW